MEFSRYFTLATLYFAFADKLGAHPTIGPQHADMTRRANQFSDPMSNAVEDLKFVWS